MTTPICNCPDNIGWLPESSWPYSEASKSSAQRIYCVDDVPVVPPRGSFKALYGRAALALDVVGFHVWPGASGEIDTTMGGVGTPLVLSNTTPYPMDFAYSVDFQWYVTLTNDGSGQQQLSHSPRVYVNGSPQASFSQRTYAYNVTPVTQVCGNFHYHLPTLAPGASMTVSLRHFYSLTNFDSALSGYGDYLGYINVWGGTTV